MRARARLLALIGSAVLLGALAVATPAMALKVTWVKSQLSSSTTSSVDPRISGNRVIWSIGEEAESGPVTLRTIGAGTTILAEGGPGWISGDRVAWYVFNQVSYRYDLYTWATDEVAPTLLETFANPRQPVGIDGDRVAWTGNVDPYAQPYQVFTWKEGDTEPTQVTTNTDRDPWEVQVSGDRLAWYETGDDGFHYMTWKVGDAHPRQVGAADTGTPSGPRVSGDRVVWSQYDGLYTQVWTWKSGDATSTQVTDDNRQHFFANVSGERLVWNMDREEAKQVFTQVWGDAEPTQVTTYDANCNYLEVSGNRIAWAMDRDGDDIQDTLATWKLGDHSPTIVATNVAQVADVMNYVQMFSLSGDKMVYVKDVAGVTQVFLAVPGAPADFEPPITTTDMVEYYSMTATISLTATDDPDGLGVAHTYTVLDNGSPVETTTVVVSALGDHTLDFWSVDLAGNIETSRSLAFTVTDDVTAPTTTSDVKSYYANTAYISLSATDNVGGTGVQDTVFSVDGDQAWEYWEAIEIDEPGRYTLRYWSVDDAGNKENVHTVTFTVVKSPASNGTPSAPSAPAKVKHKKSFTVSGYVSRHTSGSKPVELQYYRYQSKHWVLRKSGTIKVSNFLTFSKYSGSVSVPLSGKWRVRARHKVGKTWRYSGYTYITAS